jgi:hypothetical protein
MSDRASDSADRSARTDRVLRLAALGAVAIGALLVLSCAGRPRVTVSGASIGSGQADVPGGTALALAALAGGAAVLLLRGRARNLVGALIGCAGVTVAVLNLRARHDDFSFVAFAPLSPRVQTQPSAWFWLTAAGAALLVAGGVVVALRGHRWPSSRRAYDAPGTTRRQPPDPWQSLDRGEDPTL